MEPIKRIVDLLRNHYEKVVLVASIAVLAGAAWFLYSLSISEALRINNAQVRIVGKGVKGVVSVDLTRYDALSKQPPRLAPLGSPHFLFNPVKWALRTDGSLIKSATGTELGPDAMQYVRIRPLQFILSYERAVTIESGTETNVSGYRIAFTNETVRRFEGRHRPHSDIRLYTFGATNLPYFTLDKITGASNAPTELSLRAHDTGEIIPLVPGTIYQRVLDYEAELYYPIKMKKYLPMRKGAIFSVEGEQYKIIDITSNSVLLSDTVNGKQYTITTRAALPAAPAP